MSETAQNAKSSGTRKLTYSEQRLQTIEKYLRTIASWVATMGILMIFGLVFLAIVLMAGMR